MKCLTKYLALIICVLGMCGTALMYATEWGHKKIVELLKEAGAKR